MHRNKCMTCALYSLGTRNRQRVELKTFYYMAHLLQWILIHLSLYSFPTPPLSIKCVFSSSTLLLNSEKWLLVNSAHFSVHVSSSCEVKIE